LSPSRLLRNSPLVAGQMELTKEASTAATAEVTALFDDRRDQLFIARAGRRRPPSG
jgi:hypothetical protein